MDSYFFIDTPTSDFGKEDMSDPDGYLEELLRMSVEMDKETSQGFSDPVRVGGQVSGNQNEGTVPFSANFPSNSSAQGETTSKCSPTQDWMEEAVADFNLPLTSFVGDEGPLFSPPGTDQPLETIAADALRHLATPVEEIPLPLPRTVVEVVKKSGPVAKVAKTPKKSDKKRKYESEDLTDPTVKNARAARMNREKKKKELQDLREENAGLKAELEGLKEELEKINRRLEQVERRKNEEIATLRRQLAKEECRTSLSSGAVLGRIVGQLQVPRQGPSVKIEYVTPDNQGEQTGSRNRQ